MQKHLQIGLATHVYSQYLHTKTGFLLHMYKSNCFMITYEAKLQ